MSDDKTAMMTIKCFFYVDYFVTFRYLTKWRTECLDTTLALPTLIYVNNVRLLLYLNKFDIRS